MFLVHVTFVAPFGWWNGAVYKLQFNFSNLDSDGPKLKIIFSPPVTHVYGSSLCLVQLSPHSAFEIFWRNEFVERYNSRNFTPAEQMLNAIHALIFDLDILETAEGGMLGEFSNYINDIGNYAINRNNFEAAKK